jgi:hypothetical protein
MSLVNQKQLTVLRLAEFADATTHVAVHRPCGTPILTSAKVVNQTDRLW